MASVTYSQTDANGNTELVRRAARQGPPSKPGELKRRNQFTINLTDAEMKRCQVLEESSGIRHSEFWSTVLFAGIEQLFPLNNC